MKPSDSRSQYRMRQILDHLVERDMTRTQLADAMHVTRPLSLRAYLDYLVEQRQVHVTAWTPPAANGVRWAIYRYGKGRSKARPRRKTHAQVMREYHQRRGNTRRPPPPAADPFAALFHGRQG